MSKESPPAPSGVVSSVARACDVLRVVGAAKDGLTIAEIAAQVGVHPGTLRHLTSTLLWCGFLRRWDTGVGRYGLGPAAMERARDLVVQIETRHRAGMTEAEIAGTLRVPVEWMRGLLPTDGPKGQGP